MSLDNLVTEEVKENKLKSFLIDTTVNLVYWQPAFVLWELYILGYTQDQIITARTGNVALSLFLGRPFGKALNYGRKKMIKGYDPNKKPETLKEKLKIAAADTATTSVFWNAAFLPWLRYSKDILETIGIADYSKHVGLSGTEFSPEQLVFAAVAYTGLYAVAGAPYGKVLNWVRGKFEKSNTNS